MSSEKGDWMTAEVKQRAEEIGALISAEGPPAGAFEDCMEHGSINWEIWFPEHCYICHVANEDDDGNTSHCGPHCER